MRNHYTIGWFFSKGLLGFFRVLIKKEKKLKALYIEENIYNAKTLSNDCPTLPYY